MRRDYLPLWLPEALAEILSAICALGGSRIEAEEIVEGWLNPDATEDRTDRELENWIERMNGTKNDGEK